MRFNRFDLNLLAALDALLSERSVSGAARRLHLSQPAASAALARLRLALNDPILVMQGKRMVPTAHAQSLIPILTEVLGGVETLMTLLTVFDPATSSRSFRIATSDYIAMTLIAPLLRSIAQAAPGVRIEMVAPGHANLVALDRGEIDLIITPEIFLSQNHPSVLLWEERHVVVGWSGNPALRDGIDEATFFALGHVVVEFGGGREPAFVERRMAEVAARRRIEVVAPSFAAVPWLLPGTERLAMMHERLARALLPSLPITIASPPFDFPPMREMIQHHVTRAEDAGLQWLIGRMQAITS